MIIILIFFQNIQIYGPPGRLLGSVNRYSACGSNSFFEVRNAVGDSIYTVEPKFQGCFGTSFGPTEYPVRKDHAIK